LVFSFFNKMNSRVEVGYLEFKPKNGKPAISYILEPGSTTIGTCSDFDIRINSKYCGPEPFSCLIDVDRYGTVRSPQLPQIRVAHDVLFQAVIENKCNQQILYNGARMKRVQILKNNDEFVVAGKQLRYVKTTSAVAVSHARLCDFVV
jgi:hypothetical protein